MQESSTVEDPTWPARQRAHMSRVARSGQEEGYSSYAATSGMREAQVVPACLLCNEHQMGGQLYPLIQLISRTAMALHAITRLARIHAYVVARFPDIIFHGHVHHISHDTHYL